MAEIHALSMKTDTLAEFRQTHKHKAEEMLCRGGSKFDQKQREKAAGAEAGRRLD